ncbi:FAD/NAD(P)-binding protein [Chryseobacterium sp. SSA4.19]|uniref:FAD/NAD(P)-binding protein n=1 Tax=Chryseobacterium sp. SSA4.19 TaxID=2919915 RepID=UPI001F4EA2BE|nr:FAD/NAD(P)-binding protein [Chryseobacterium sp. SSA4.19]MCJ8154640.1 FAD/NAD(P)-binding protein [Chryseobacterium sp. SSA4.19]
MENNDTTIALIGGGPAALFAFKHILLQNIKPETIYIFEKNERLGAGMPYSRHGADHEHVANVSANELPELYEDFVHYIKKHYPADFPEFVENGTVNEYEVIPRLLLGNYLEEQFKNYIQLARKEGINVHIHTGTSVKDIVKKENEDHFTIVTEDQWYTVSVTIICTGHFWPLTYEQKQPGWYDSPYPPSKFSYPTDYPVAVRGTSLTAIDAVKTLARRNGKFVHAGKELKYYLNDGSKDFSISLFSLRGFLPALRFHTEEDAYSEDWIMSIEDIYEYKKSHGGFVDLDYVYDLHFMQPLKRKNPDFYEKIKDLSMEEFVEKMLTMRDELDSFELFKAEYAEAEKSIRRHESIAWKEALSAFSYAVNYPAKHFSAEDMLRLRKTLLPLISVIIASLPQSSYREVIALYNAGLIRLVSVGEDSHIEPHHDQGAVYHYTDSNGQQTSEHYQLYIDAIGQQPIQFNDVPFEGLKQNGLISSGYLKFKSPENAKAAYQKDHKNIIETDADQYYLKVKGLNINDHFQALDYYGKRIPDLFIMAVPYIAGLNPDYSGLDFCDTAAKRIADTILDINKIRDAG